MQWAGLVNRFRLLLETLIELLGQRRGDLMVAELVCWVLLVYAACYAAHSDITTSWTALPLTEIAQTQVGR